MRISKSDAETAAVKMTEKKKKEIDDLKKELEDVGYLLAKKTIKKEVLEFYEKYKGYFRTTQTVSVSGTGLNFQQIQFKNPLPKSDTGAWCINSLVDDKTAKKIISLTDKIDEKEKELSSLMSDIQNAIIALGTRARIEEQFKEALPFLPIKTKQELQVNISDVKRRL